MKHQLNNGSFEASVDGWVRAALGRSVADFGSLLSVLPGVYPTEALASLGRLSLGTDVAAKLAARMARSACQNHRAVTNYSPASRLPVPHPLDFEWRFAKQAANLLLNECDAVIDDGEVVALLGSPSLIPEASERGNRLGLIVLDSNEEMTTFLREHYPSVSTRRCDILRDELPAASAGAVVADPPWYPEHLHAFMWACCDLCKIGGYIFVGIPPVGTRPGIAAEREEFFAWTGSLGLDLIRIDQGMLPYRTPLFERNSLRSAGIYNVPSVWRRGDLAVFRRTEVAVISRPEPPSAGDHSTSWVEERLGRVRVRLREPTVVSFDDPTLHSVLEGDILPSVSRRDPRRKQADVWTSGNRIFRCLGTGILHVVVRALRVGTRPATAVEDCLGRPLAAAEAGLVARATQQVQDLLEVEQDEHSSYGEDHAEAGITAVAV